MNELSISIYKQNITNHFYGSFMPFFEQSSMTLFFFYNKMKERSKMNEKYYFTLESIVEERIDKLCDYISKPLLDEHF